MLHAPAKNKESKRRLSVQKVGLMRTWTAPRFFLHHLMRGSVCIGAPALGLWIRRIPCSSARSMKVLRPTAACLGLPSCATVERTSAPLPQQAC